jgi:hypothetical protein
MEALVRYVTDGGAVVFLGGEQSFGRGGYAPTPLARLLPWSITEREPELQRGRFPVSIPRAVADHPILAGIDELLKEAGDSFVESANSPGAVKPGAVTLMHAGLGTRIVPLIALQRVGNGKTLAIASNTLWKWSRESSVLRRVYGLFWRQAVRELGGQTEGGRHLAVKWDRDHYRPGEEAVVEVRLAGGKDHAGWRLAAALRSNGDTLVVPVQPLQGQPETLTARMVFRQRGTYHFSLTAFRGEDRLESYEKTLEVAPRMPEGAKLAVDATALAALAEKASGLYVPENDTERLMQHLTRQTLERTIVSDTSLVYGGPHFAVLFLLILAAEWILRRRMNLF